jgi:hypothetical protein
MRVAGKCCTLATVHFASEIGSEADLNTFTGVETALQPQVSQMRQAAIPAIGAVDEIAPASFDEIGPQVDQPSLGNAKRKKQPGQPLGLA